MSFRLVEEKNTYESFNDLRIIIIFIYGDSIYLTYDTKNCVEIMIDESDTFDNMVRNKTLEFFNKECINDISRIRSEFNIYGTHYIAYVVTIKNGLYYTLKNAFFGLNHLKCNLLSLYKINEILIDESVPDKIRRSINEWKFNHHDKITIKHDSIF